MYTEPNLYTSQIHPHHDLPHHLQEQQEVTPQNNLQLNTHEVDLP